MSVNVPSLDRRIYAEELMDDLSADSDQLRRALNELRYVNAFLGGYRALRRCLLPYFARRNGSAVRVLDLGAGLGDNPERIVRWGDDAGVEVHVTAVEANEAAVACARSYLDERLPAPLRDRVRVMHADATRLPFADDAFDAVTASLFLHHFDADESVEMVGEMARIASDGILINDLHRHPVAYAGIRAIAAVLPVSDMFANDGPLSVRRAFRPEELRQLADDVGLKHASVARHWPFRLTLSTI